MTSPPSPPPRMQGATLHEMLHNAANAAKIRAARPAVLVPEVVELDGVPAIKLQLFKQDALTGEGLVRRRACCAAGVGQVGCHGRAHRRAPHNAGPHNAGRRALQGGQS